MSKPDLPGNSLEEILASIRKTLTDDRPEDGLSKLDNLPPAAQDNGAAGVNGHSVNGADALPDRLVDALGGGGNRHTQADLTALLASDAPSQTEASKPQVGDETTTCRGSCRAVRSRAKPRPNLPHPALSSSRPCPPRPRRSR